MKLQLVPLIKKAPNILIKRKLNYLFQPMKSCQICKCKLISLHTIAYTPLEDKYTKKPNYPPKYPLDLSICEKCSLVQLATLVSPKISYKDYLYQSKTTVGLDSHYKQYAEKIINKLNIPKESLILDIGSNDGSFLAHFKEMGMKVLGIEPSNGPAQAANQNGIETIRAFFSKEIARYIEKKYGEPDVICANYMFANIKDLGSFLSAVAECMKPKTVISIQTGYHPLQWKKMMFDYVYHEHFYYFTLTSLQKLLRKYSIEIFHAETNDQKGGSLRIFSSFQSLKENNHSVDKLLKKEKKDSVHLKSYYKRFFQKVEILKGQIENKIKSYKKSNLSVVGFGASHSTTTFLHTIKIGKYLECIADDNPLKHYTHSPGFNLRVLPSQAIHKIKPDIVIILGWQHAKAILTRHKNMLFKGIEIVVPLPNLMSFKK